MRGSSKAFLLKVRQLFLSELLVTDLWYAVSEMKIISVIWNWSIINQIFLGILVKSDINIKYGKMPLNWSPDKICGKVFNEPWFSLFVTCLISYLFLVLKRKRLTKLKTSKESLQLKRKKTNISVSKRKSFYLKSHGKVLCRERVL